MEALMWIVASLAGTWIVVTPMYLLAIRNDAPALHGLPTRIEVMQFKPFGRLSYVGVPISVRNITHHTLDAAAVECDARRPDGRLADTAAVSFGSIREGQSLSEVAVFMHLDKTGIDIVCKPV